MITSRDEKKEEKTVKKSNYPQSIVFDNPDMLNQMESFLDRGSVSSLRSTNKAILNKSSKLLENKYKRNLNFDVSLHLLSAYAKATEGNTLFNIISHYLTDDFSFGHHNYLSVYKEEFLPKIKELTANKINCSSIFEPLCIMILSGDTAAINDYFNSNLPFPEDINQKIALGLLEHAVLSGEISMVEAVMKKLGDFTKLRAVDHEDEKSYLDRCYKEMIDRYRTPLNTLNLNYLIHPAISSNNKFMLNYVIQHFIDKNIKDFSPRFSIKCLVEAFATDNEEIKNILIHSDKLKPLFAKANAYQYKFDEYWFNRSLITRLYKAVNQMRQKDDIHQIISDFTFFLKYLKKINNIQADLTTEIYLTTLDKDEVYRQKIIEEYELPQWEFDLYTFNELISQKIHLPKQIEVLFNIFNIDIKTWRTDVSDLSLAEKAAKEGALNTLEHALTKWKVPVNYDLIYEDSYRGGGLLRLIFDKSLSIAPNPAIINYVFEYLSDQSQFDWKKVCWEKIIYQAVDANGLNYLFENIGRINKKVNCEIIESVKKAFVALYGDEAFKEIYQQYFDDLSKNIEQQSKPKTNIESCSLFAWNNTKKRSLDNECKENKENSAQISSHNG